MPRPVASGHTSSAASSSVPGPVPRSRIRRGPGVPSKCSIAEAISTSRIRARHEHSGTDMKVDVPEGAAAGDVGDRLALATPLDHLRRSASAPSRSGGESSSRSRSMCSASAISSSASRRGVSLVLLSWRVASSSARAIGFTPLRAPPAARLRPRRPAPRPARPGRALRALPSSLCRVRLMRWSVIRPCGKL